MKKESGKNAAGKQKTESMTIKERRFLDLIMTGLGTVEAAKNAGFKPSYAHELRRKLAGKREFANILEMAGLDNGTLAIHMAQMFGAMQYKYHPLEQDYVPFPDNQARLIVLRMALEAKQLLKATERGGDYIPPDMTAEEARLYVLGQRDLPNK
jgi:DNA-binding CsgD family transcriptional regulator